jgi:hypothetical protein
MAAKPAPSPKPENDPAFVFVQDLAAELNSGKVELPSFPDIALRVRQVLSDELVPTEQVVRVINSEPALAAQLLRISNSRALNASGKLHTDLRTAVARMGFNLVRSAAISFAMAQLKKVESLKGLEQPLEQLWQRSAAVAAMCHAVARRHSNINPDKAAGGHAARLRTTLHPDALGAPPGTLHRHRRAERDHPRLERAHRQGAAGELVDARGDHHRGERVRGPRS